MLKNLFLPHPQTHKKAHLLSWQGLVVYIALFIFLQEGFSVLNTFNPNVLGIDSEVSVREVIRLTNIERQKKGLEPLIEDQKLTVAASEKGKNMFEENYWAHYSPTGKTPWEFITKSGYKYSYAGENLARNFYKSEDVVKAWMNSPTHRDNLLNANYKNIGISVLEGQLLGQKTVLIVQEFGTPTDYVANVKPDSTSLVAQNDTQSLGVAQNTLKSGISFNLDKFKLLQTFGISVLFLISSLLVIDFIVIKKRAVVRLSTRYLPHMAFMAMSASVLINSSPGSIL